MGKGFGSRGPVVFIFSERRVQPLLRLPGNYDEEKLCPKNKNNKMKFIF